MPAAEQASRAGASRFKKRLLTMAQLKMLLKILISVLMLTLSSAETCQTIMERLASESSLSQFYTLIQNNYNAISTLNRNRELTIFAPTNDAFENYNEMLTDDLVLYHIVPMARTIENLNDAYLDPLMEAHPPIWLNHKGKDIYVNNAKILTNNTKIIKYSNSCSPYKKAKILHILDEVITPMVPISTTTNTCHTAYDFLVQPNLWKLVPYSYSIFHMKIVQHKMQNLFKIDRKNTYFIPADQFLDVNTIAKIDKEAIDACVIANRVVFTRSSYEDSSYITRGLDKDFYNLVEFFDDFVKIVKISKDTKQTVSEKTVKILYANIPVKNGVIHVTSDVLGVFERKLTKFPFLPAIYKVQSDPALNITEYLLRKTKLDKFLDADNVNYTLFLPNDQAWTKLAKRHSMNLTDFDGKLFMKQAWNIMRRHLLIGEYYNIPRLMDLSDNLRGREVVLNVGTNKLYVKVIKFKEDFYILWGQKVIKITRPDYECSNGVIHITDEPFIFDSEISQSKTKEEYSSLLFQTWNLLKKSVL